MKQKKSYFDIDFLKDFTKSFLSLLFALAILLLGNSIIDLLTPETHLIDIGVAKDNITKYMELEYEAEKAATLTKAVNSFSVAIGIILLALIITLIIAWYSQKRKNSEIRKSNN